MLTKSIRLVALMTALCLATSAGSNEHDGSVQAARKAIEAANAKFSKAFARGDAKALAARYTSDAIVFPPGSDMIRGNEAIGKFWKATRGGGVQGASLTTIDVGRNGDVAYEVGKVTLTIQPRGKKPTTEAAKYVVVWKQQVDGSWKLHRDIWNGLPATK